MVPSATESASIYRAVEADPDRRLAVVNEIGGLSACVCRWPMFSACVLP
jgi:hypothetical protein